MKKYYLLLLIIWGVLLIFNGCASIISSEQRKINLSESYVESAQKYEQETEYVKAYEQYKLALTANPSNETALKKKKELEGKLKRLSDIHCNAGIKFLKMGKFKSAEKHFLKATYYWPENKKAASYLSKNKKNQDDSKYVIYELKPGDTLSKLSKQYYGDYKKYHIIAEFNNMENAANAKVGQKIKIPKIEGLPFNPPSQGITKEKKTDAVKAMSVAPQRPSSPQSVGVSVDNTDDGQLLPEETEDKTPDSGEEKTVEIAAPESIQSESAPMDDSTDDMLLPETTVEEETFFSESESEPIDAEGEEVTESDEQASMIEGYREAGIELFTKNNYNMAIAEFEKLVNMVPDDSVAIDYLSKCHFNLGVIEFEKKEYQQAKNHFALAKQYDESCTQCDDYSNKCDIEYKDMHYKKGAALYSQQKLNEAIEEWRLVEAMDPEYMDVKKYLSKAETLLRRLEQIKQE